MEQRLTIGVLIGNANSPYSMNLISGIHSEASKRGINTVFFLGIHNGPAYKAYFGADEMDNYDYQFNSIYDNVALTRVDALIIDLNSMIVYMDNKDPVRFLEKFRDIPYILVGDRDPSGMGSSLVFDSYGGMSGLVEHLVSEHHYRRFALLSGPQGNRDAMDRMRAVQEVLAAHDIPFGDKQLAYGDFTRMVHPQVNRLLDNNPSLEVLICGNDFMADTAYGVCQSRGLRVGVDIAVTGYDDWVNASVMDPPLTTVKQNEWEFGRNALIYALELLETRKPRVVQVPVELQLRQSCGCMQAPASRLTSASETKFQNDQLDKFNLESWFISLISRNMMNTLEDRCGFYRSALNKLPAFRIRNSWLFLFPEPVRYEQGSAWTPPDHLTLVAEQHGAQVTAYNPESAPTLDHSHTLESFWRDDKDHDISVLCLYSGEMQYGILVVEVDPQDLALSYLISIQIANALHYYELFKAQQNMQHTLENLLAEIREKNEVLNFLSEYDALTGCLNRRGFMERAFSMNHANLGSEALMLFADLDHLKEINDTFGHAEGDYAIRQASAFIYEAAGSDSVVGRIGGDEFVALIPATPERGGDKLIKQIHSAYDLFNRLSEKPYYVEISLGVKHITFNESLSLAAALKEADEFLYVAKRQRKPSACKPSDLLGGAAPDQPVPDVNPLTGLYYNQSFFRQVDEYVKHIRPEDYCLAAIDIENFRLFNKWYGRSEGDHLLIEIGHMLRSIQEKNGGVAGYLSGDNFAILLPDNEALLVSLQQTIQRYVRHLGRSFGFTPAIGVYRLRSRLLPAINMYDYATIAQNTVLNHYGSFIRYYDESMIESREKELVLISEVNESLARHEFTFYLQPQVELSTGALIGAESLVRWIHPTRGLIPPGEFIPVLERMGFIADLDRYVWEAACQWLRSWIDRGREPIPVSVNISRIDFFLLDVPEHLRQLVEKYQLPPRTLKVEITESAVADEDLIRRNVDVLRSMGFVVMIDDFGNGYSSMSVLHDLQVEAHLSRYFFTF